MLDIASMTEFADKYSDHIVFASSAGTGTVLSQLVRVIPVEIAALITAAIFVALRVCIHRYWHKRAERKHIRRHRGRPRSKSRTPVTTGRKTA